MWKVRSFVRTGSMDGSNRTDCQDYVLHANGEPIHVITMADGVGEDELACAGAGCTCRTVAELMAKYFDELYSMEKSLLQFQVITNVRTELYSLCEKHGAELNQFRSTIMAVAVDTEGERFLALHLGDGKIRVKKDGRLRVLSYPENGINPFRTHMTTERQAGKHIRIYRGNTTNISAFMLVSDGPYENTAVGNAQNSSEFSQNTGEKRFPDDSALIVLRKL